MSDSPAPKNITDALKVVANDTANIALSQYARAQVLFKYYQIIGELRIIMKIFQGHPRLVNALAELYYHKSDIRINAMTNILITVGALAAMQAAINGLIDDGDEAIVIEPFFDAYDKLVHLAGGVTKYVSLRPCQV